jgi:hypothetical protein
MDLEARILINGRVHEVPDFVYYFLECILVIKARRFQGERAKELKRLEFQLRVAPGDWRSIQIKGQVGVTVVNHSIKRKDNSANRGVGNR